ncbi:hypothetical protein TNCV_1956991 [Trichonephila clavipes]|nr:hypothetical protein TNCV_1956991 [Trichonephila clavipes]
MSTVECDANIPHVVPYFAQHYPAAVEAIYPIPSVSARDEGVLVCRRIVSGLSATCLPKASHTFSMGFRSGERAGHTRRLIPRCLDNPEQRVSPMPCCVVVHKTNLSPTAPEKTNMRK